MAGQYVETNFDYIDKFYATCFFAPIIIPITEPLNHTFTIRKCWIERISKCWIEKRSPMTPSNKMDTTYYSS